MISKPRLLAQVLLASAPAFCRADPPAATTSSPASASAAAPASAPAWQLADGPALLARVADFTFNFDEPAFYWLVRRVQTHDDPSRFAIRKGDAPTPWRCLLERPSEYRGKRVLIEGIVQSSQAYTLQPQGQPEFGPVLQTELSDPATRGLCTVITVAPLSLDNASSSVSSRRAIQPLPLRARVQAMGYFLKARRFKTRAGDISDAPLLVAHHLDMVASPASPREFWTSRGGLFSPQNILLLATGGLAIVWLIVRRITQRPARPHYRRISTPPNSPK